MTAAELLYAAALGASLAGALVPEPVALPR
jgi:hypothetical protein